MGEACLGCKPVQFRIHEAGCLLHIHGKWTYRSDQGTEARAHAGETIDAELWVWIGSKSPGHSNGKQLREVRTFNKGKGKGVAKEWAGTSRRCSPEYRPTCP